MSRTQSNGGTSSAFCVEPRRIVLPGVGLRAGAATSRSANCGRQLHGSAGAARVHLACRAVNLHHTMTDGDRQPPPPTGRASRPSSPPRRPTAASRGRGSRPRRAAASRPRYLRSADQGVRRWTAARTTQLRSPKTTTRAARSQPPARTASSCTPSGATYAAPMLLLQGRRRRRAVAPAAVHAHVARCGGPAISQAEHPALGVPVRSSTRAAPPS